MLLEWNEVWKYTNAGFPVYIVTPEPEKGPAGHIAIAFPIGASQLIKIKEVDDVYDNGLVVQAGSGYGKMTISQAWIKKLDPDNDKRFFKIHAKVYLYLGFLTLK